MKKLRMGTRGSALALAQSLAIAEQVRHQHKIEVEIVVVKTAGDQLSERGQSALSAGQGQGVFTKELEEALLGATIDCAVHSFKDMATSMPKELVVAAIPKRASPEDCWVSLSSKNWSDAAKNLVVGTSSLRRQIQLRALRPDFEIVSLRGNLDTRLGKLENGETGAIVVAIAGIERLLLKSQKNKFNFYKIPVEQMVPAPAQGALALQVRRADLQTQQWLSFLEDAPTRTIVECERHFLRTLQAGCSAPVGAYAVLEKNTIILEGLMGSWDLQKMLRRKVSAAVTDAAALAEKLAREFLKEIRL